ncbi:MAG: hypothetical protein QME62_08420 [Armatimonadota bacterium]|nr:hypothetical protein [Armatimonadota bacterium]
MRLNRVGWCIVVSALYLLMRVGLPMLRIKTLRPDVAAFISICAFMLVQLALMIAISRAQFKPASALFIIIPSLILTIALTYLMLKVKLPNTILVDCLLSVRSLSMMLLAGALGCLVSFVISEPNLLLPAAVFAALVDYWSVTWGPLSHLLTNAMPAVAAASIQVPSIGHPQPVTMIGIGDFVFLALFFSALYRFNMNIKGAFWLGYALLTASMLVVLYYNTALPALVPMGIAVISMNLKYFKLKREELIAIIYAGIFLLALIFIAGFFFLRK